MEPDRIDEAPRAGRWPRAEGLSRDGEDVAGLRLCDWLLRLLVDAPLRSRRPNCALRPFN